MTENADYRMLTAAQVARVLADEAWHGRWNPLDESNVLPLAHHTAMVLYAAGYVMSANDGRGTP